MNARTLALGILLAVTLAVGFAVYSLATGTTKNAIDSHNSELSQVMEDN